MEQKEIIAGFVQLGGLMRSIGNRAVWPGFESGLTEDEYQKLLTIVEKEQRYNGWFTRENVEQSILALGEQLTEDKLEAWAESYSFTKNPKRIAIIMAGNIPMVGFHDFLCVLVSGNIAICKLSSDDQRLLPAFIDHLLQFAPELKDRIEIISGKLENIDGVIATGSDNSTKYFEQYFGKYHHVFRGNRTSVAVLNGSESKEDLERLGEDVFSYFGLGCRNVTHLIIPTDFDLNRFFEGVYPYSDVINNNKYGNNYDYNKAVFLMNKHQLLDNNFVLLRESRELFSPLGMVYYHRYSSMKEVVQYIKEHEEKIQVVVGENGLDFGLAQHPGLSDYADNVDIMKWLNDLNR